MVGWWWCLASGAARVCRLALWRRRRRRRWWLVAARCPPLPRARLQVAPTRHVSNGRMQMLVFDKGGVISYKRIVVVFVNVVVVVVQEEDVAKIAKM